MIHLKEYLKLSCNIIIDDIFSDEQDLDVLIKGWNNLQKAGFKDDEIAGKISELILKEIGFDPTQKPVEK